MIDPGGRLLRALEEAEVHLKLIQDYRKGGDYDLNQVRGSIISLKEELGHIRLWSKAWSKNFFGKEIEMSMEDLSKSLDLALGGIEAAPQYARFALQYALMQGQMKIETVLADVSAFKDLLRRGPSSLRR